MSRQSTRRAQHLAAAGAKLYSPQERAAELSELCKRLNRERLGTRFLVLGARGGHAPVREDFWDDMLTKYLLDPSASKRLFTGELVIGPHEDPIPFDHRSPAIAFDRIIGKLQQAERMLSARGPLSAEASELARHHGLLQQCIIALGDVRALAVAEASSRRHP